MKNQLFIVTEEAFFAMSTDEVAATVAALKEAKLYALPFPTVDVRIAGDCVTRCEYIPRLDDMVRRGLMFHLPEDPNTMLTNYGPGYWMQFRNISLDHHNYIKESVIENNEHFDNRVLAVNAKRDGGKYAPKPEERNAVADTLIVLLATRNAVKTTAHHKSAKFGIGKGIRKYEYVTTISLPKELENDEEHPPTGKELAPHLRRAHIRRQHYGPKNSLIKTVLIPSVFVNADKGWVKSRKAYNISL